MGGTGSRIPRPAFRDQYSFWKLDGSSWIQDHKASLRDQLVFWELDDSSELQSLVLPSLWEFPIQIRVGFSMLVDLYHPLRKEVHKPVCSFPTGEPAVRLLNGQLDWAQPLAVGPGPGRTTCPCLLSVWCRSCLCCLRIMFLGAAPAPLVSSALFCTRTTHAGRWSQLRW